MAKAINVYVKKQLRLDLLNAPQKEMFQLGQLATISLLNRVKAVKGPDDGTAPPLRSEKWKRIKKAKGLRPVRDLHGTGLFYAQGKKKGKLKSVPHLLDEIKPRKVMDNRVIIPEPSTRAGRQKARGNKSMLLFSPDNVAAIVRAANQMLHHLKDKLVTAKTMGLK